MGNLPNIGYPQTGDTVQSGTYACMNCPHTEPDDKAIVILNKQKKLPECPVCGYTYWMPM